MGGPKVPKEQKAAMRAQAEQLEALKKLPLPELEKLALTNPELVGLLQAEELGQSALENIQTDSRLKDTQMQALQAIKDRSEQGLTSEDKLAMEQMLGQTDAAAKSRQEGIKQDMARRGTLDSGVQLAASLAGQQGDASRSRQQAMQMAAQASANRAQAAQQMAGMAGQMEQADYGRQANAATAKDRIAQANAAARMQTNQQNLAARQAIENQKAALQNQETTYNIGLAQQQYQNQLAKLGAQQSASNSYSQMAASMPQKGSSGQLLGTLAGAGIGAMVAPPGGAMKGAQMGAGLGGSIGALLQDGGTVHANDGSLMYRPESTEIQTPDMFQSQNVSPVMMTSPQKEAPQVSVPKNLDIFKKQLTDNELKQTFEPERSEYVTKPKDSADIPYRKEFGGFGGSGEKVKAEAKPQPKKESSFNMEDLAGILSSVTSSSKSPKPTKLDLNTNVQYAQPENVLANRIQAQQFANPFSQQQDQNPFAAKDGGTYYHAENGDLMHKSSGKGDIVQGDSFANDRVDAKLNSGEMVLNVTQQQRLMDLLRGKADIKDLGDKDIVEGVPREYREELKAKNNLQNGGKVLSQEELDMLNQAESMGEQEIDPMEEMVKQEAKARMMQEEAARTQAIEEAKKSFMEQAIDQQPKRSPASVPQKIADSKNEQVKSPHMEKKEVTPEEFDPSSEYKKLLQEYNKLRQEPSKDETMRGLGTLSDILNTAVANYNPYYRPYQGSQEERVMKEESSAKKDKLDKITTMAELLNKYKQVETKSQPKETFEQKELIKEDVKQRTENRKERKQIEKDISNTEKLLNSLEDTKNLFDKYSKGSIAGTGPIATAGGLTKYASSDLQRLDSKFKEQNVDTMAKTFQGMSKAVDSDAERRAFEAAQPSITNDDEVNRAILEERIKAAKNLLAKQQRTYKSIDKEGNLLDNEPTMDVLKTPELSDKDKQALEWANKNPKDPRAIKIKERLGM